MATWPVAIKHLIRSDLAPEGGIRWRRMASGKPNARKIHDVDMWRGQIVSAGDSDDVDTVLLFYENNDNVTFTLPYMGDDEMVQEPTNYTAFFESRPRWEYVASETYYIYSSIVAWEA